MRWRAQSVVHLRNQAEPVAALLAVLGLRIAEVPVTETLVTSGLRALRPANVSSRLRACYDGYIVAQARPGVGRDSSTILLCFFDQYPHQNTTSQDDDDQFGMPQMRCHWEIWQT